MANSSNRSTYDSNYDSDTYGGKRSHSVINDVATSGIASQAVNESIYSYLPGREDGPADAYRHLLLSAELARTNTETFTRAVLAAHEFTGNAQDQTSDANKMDEHNNELGIQLGLRLKNRPDGGSWEMVIKGARELMTNGSAKWLPQEKWRKNPKDDNGKELPLNHPEMNWPIDWNKAQPYQANLQHTLPNSDNLQYAQIRSLTLDDIPDQAKKLYTQTEDRMRAFYAEFGIPFREQELKNAAAVLAATAYEKKLPEVQDFELHNGKMVAFYESRGGAYKEALLDADFANNMPQQQSFARMVETEPKLEEAARQRALEIAAHEQSRGMGRSV